MKIFKQIIINFLELISFKTANNEYKYFFIINQCLFWFSVFVLLFAKLNFTDTCFFFGILLFSIIMYNIVYFALKSMEKDIEKIKEIDKIISESNQEIKEINDRLKELLKEADKELDKNKK